MVLFTVQCRKKIAILVHKYCNLTKKGTEWHSSFVRYIFFLGLKKGTDRLCFWKEKTLPQSEWFYLEKIGHSLVFRAWSWTFLPWGIWFETWWHMPCPQLTHVPGGPAPGGGLSAPTRGLRGHCVMDFRCWWVWGEGKTGGGRCIPCSGEK